MKSIFDQADTIELTNRIDKLSATTRPLWGKMDAEKCWRISMLHTPIPTNRKNSKNPISSCDLFCVSW